MNISYRENTHFINFTKFGRQIIKINKIKNISKSKFNKNSLKIPIFRNNLKLYKLKYNQNIIPYLTKIYQFSNPSHLNNNLFHLNSKIYSLNQLQFYIFLCAKNLLMSMIPIKKSNSLKINLFKQ